MIELHVQHQGTTIKRFQCTTDQISIGSRNCDLILDFPSISRMHLLINQMPDGKVFATDCNSKNGSKMLLKARQSPQKLVPGEQVIWPNGSLLYVGPFSLHWVRTVGPENDTSQVENLLFSKYEDLLEINGGDRANALEQHLLDFPEPRRNELRQKVLSEFHGNGPVQYYLADQKTKEILINKFDLIYVDQGDGLKLSGDQFISNSSYLRWVQRTVMLCARRLDPQNPICEGTLPDGSRFHAVLGPIAGSDCVVAIRRFGVRPVSEDQAVRSEWISASALQLLKSAIATKQNIVISGGTSAGKTSLLNFLCQFIDEQERIITVEDTIELQLHRKNVVQLQSRRANADGSGAISMRELVQCSLRMRPDRIIVGECRGAEVIDMLQALNTGHPGSLTTVHANSCQMALLRLELLGLLHTQQLSAESIRNWISQVVDVVVQVEKLADGRRRVTEIVSRTPIDGRFETVYSSRDA